MSAIPIIYGPNDTSGVSEPDFFTRPSLGKTEVRSDCITTTFQKPKHTGVSEGKIVMCDFTYFHGYNFSVCYMRSYITLQKLHWCM